MKTTTCLVVAALALGLAAAACGGGGKDEPAKSLAVSASPAADSAKSNEAKVEAPLELVQQPLSVQAVKGYVTFLASLPRDWPIQDVGGAQLVRDPEPSSNNAITITFKAFVPVKDLSAAETQLREVGGVGSDAFEERRQLGAGKFLIATAPRSVAKLVTVSIITSGKKAAVLAKCTSTAARRPELEKICSSVVLQ